MRFFLLLLFFSADWFSAPLRAQARAPKSRAVVLPADSAIRSVRRPEAVRWEELRTDRDFQYGQDVTPPSTFLDRLWSQIKEWFFNWLFGPENQTTRDWLTVVFVAVVLGFAAYKIWQMDKRGVFARRGTSLEVPYEVRSENIHTIPFDEEIAESVRNRNYRLAVRLYYLKILKDLSDRDLIHWQLDKTNHAYVHELEKTALKAEFERITSQFEYVWYGHFSLNEPQFATLRAEFDAFRRALPAR